MLKWNESFAYMKRFISSKSTEQGSDSATVLTAQMFFGKFGQFKYADPNQFLEFGESLRDEDEEQLAHFFDLVKEGLKMQATRRRQTDRGGRLYKYENFIRAKGTDGAKVILFGKLEQFIRDYQNGLFRTDFTLDDLIAEAHKS